MDLSPPTPWGSQSTLHLKDTGFGTSTPEFASSCVFWGLVPSPL